MISKEQIAQAVDLLVKIANPSKVILFGSYGRGEAGDESDLDLLVIEARVPDKLAEMVRLRRALRPLKIPVDVVVASEQEVGDWGHLPGTLYYWALTEGTVLHEAAA